MTDWSPSPRSPHYVSPTESPESSGLTLASPQESPDSRSPKKYNVVDSDGRRRCVGTVRSTGERCKLPPRRYQTQCHKHGGNAPHSRRKALVRQNQALAVAALEKQGFTEITDPVAAHLQIASKLYGLVEILEAQVSTLTVITNYDMQGTEAISAVLAAYQASLKDTAQVLNQVNKLDLLERRFQMEQADIRMVADAVQRGIWSDLAGLDYDQATQVQNAVSAEFVRLQQLAS